MKRLALAVIVVYMLAAAATIAAAYAGSWGTRHAVAYVTDAFLD